MGALALTPDQLVPTGRLRTADGLSLAWYELAAGSGGPPIVLHHGFSSSTWFEWVECGVAAAVIGVGRPVFGLDARGHGQSDKPHESRFYGRGFMPRDLMDFVTARGFEAYDLVGYSMGGAVAAAVAAVDRRVRRVVISGVGEGVVTGNRAFDGRRLARAFRAGSDEGLDAFERGMRAGAIMRGNDLLALAAHNEAMQVLPLDVSTITARTLVMAGDSDPVAQHPEAIARAIPGAELVIVPGDHWHSKRSPEFSAALAAFLAR